jgi:hypothetical protein
MGTLVLTGATSGSTTIQPTDAQTVTLTLPAASGSQTLGIQGPAFFVYPSGTFTAANATDTKVPFNSKATVGFDTNSNFDLTTNYRFTPTVAGYYQISAGLTSTATGTGFCAIKIYKNSASFVQIAYSTATANYLGATGSALIYFNGSTDYIEFYVNQNSGVTATFNAGYTNTWATGCLVRGA